MKQKENCVSFILGEEEQGQQPYFGEVIKDLTSMSSKKLINSAKKLD